MSRNDFVYLIEEWLWHCWQNGLLPTLEDTGSNPGIRFSIMNICLLLNKEKEAGTVHKKPGALVLWLWEETHVPKDVGSNPSTVYWMDICHFNLL